MSIQIWCMIYSTISVAFGNPNVEFKSNDVDRLFQQLETYGKTELTDYKNIHKDQSNMKFVQQYLTVAVLSEQEVKDPKNWADQLPDWLKRDNSRLRVIFNRKIGKDVFHTNPKIPLHGEISFLYLDSNIDEMLNSFKAKQKESFPFVFVFSFYIPCANIKNIEYSCSEELAHHAVLHKNDYQMVVGWSHHFVEKSAKTDVGRSKNYMSLGGIQQFEKENGIFQKQSTSELFHPTEIIIQALYFKCLNSLISEDCCVIDSFTDSEDKNNRKRGILAYYINSMYHTCTQESKWKGPLTQLRLAPLSKCTENYINKNTGSACKTCSSHRTKHLLETCSLYSQAYATHIGKPFNVQDPYNPEWVLGPVSWSDLYKGCNFDVTQNSPMYCFMPGVSMKSLCTKMGDDYKNLPDKYKSKIQQIRQQQAPHFD
ncbi:Hypothetical predicted protein [Mytilus galloprovincialis]|uniref:Uncharacterized protein n=1 Tax=Mytilus galloprovincialis TaxID=29158 RepID=A0A8B6D4P4_MYTGA|nr:Hypothetical predicted protein [Mytilus galloprovincialis]